MNVQELRIGNVVKVSLINTVMVKGIHPKTLLCEESESLSGEDEFADMIEYEGSDTWGNTEIEEFLPIDLTEKILLKCGFKKINDRGYCSDEEKKTIYSCGLVDIAFSNENFFLWVEVDEDPYYSFCCTKIEYLHQLQNIVFAISGTELEINL